jgi:hypothetical protein
MTLLPSSVSPTMTYTEFHPARRPEEFVGLAGPHGGLALPHDVLEAIAQARVSNRPHQYLVRGEWVRSDGARYLDIAVDRAWLTASTNYQLVDGMLRWTCPACGRLSGAHSKGCDYR